MGAKNCPETPRQKMINMMYIVLTAMLALNVSAEVLEAFRLVDSSLLHTMKGVDAKNNQIYTAFEQAYIENPIKVQEWKNKADEVRKISADMISYISDLKEELVKYSGYTEINDENPYDPERSNYITQSGDSLEIKKEDDLNGPSEMMITQKKATELKERIIEYKNSLVGNIGDDDAELKETILSMLETPDPSSGPKEADDLKTWESQYFESKPLIAVLTVLSKMQSTLKTQNRTSSTIYILKLMQAPLNSINWGQELLQMPALYFKANPTKLKCSLLQKILPNNRKYRLTADR